MKKILFILIILCLVSVNDIFSEQKEIIFVINGKSPLKTIMLLKEIKDIYLGKIKFNKNEMILPVNQKDKEILAAFLSEFIDMTEREYKNFWVKEVFAKGGNAPKMLEKTEDVIKYVSENEVAIGYILKANLTGKESNIKIVNIVKEIKK